MSQFLTIQCHNGDLEEIRTLIEHKLRETKRYYVEKSNMPNMVKLHILNAPKLDVLSVFRIQGGDDE